MAVSERCVDGWLSGSFIAPSLAEPSPSDDLPHSQPSYHISVNGYQTAWPVRFRIVVQRGEGEWRCRRRFKQVVAFHRALSNELQGSPLLYRLPVLPPRVAIRQSLYGPQDRLFLATRKEQLQQYFNELLQVIPSLDESLALRSFLFQDGDLPERSNDYGYLLSLGELLGPGERARSEPPVSSDAVLALPKASISCIEDSVFPNAASKFCVVCQDTMDLRSSDDDVRVLPCGHLFHFKCISSWLQQRNSCCVCQQLAIPATTE